MEPYIPHANRGVSIDAPAAPANPRDRDFNPTTSDLGNTSINPVTDVRSGLHDGDQAESDPGAGIPNSGGGNGGVQLHDKSTTESVASQADAVQRQINLAGSMEEFPGASGRGCQDANNNNSACNELDGNGDDCTSQPGIVPDHPQALISRSTNSDVTTGEPFPDYYESCETNPPVLDRAQEEAYNYAISKVVEEVIRFREVDSSITALPTPPDSQIANAKEDTDQKESCGDDNAPEECRQASGKANELTPFEDLIQLLSDPGLKPSTQQRFMGIANMVLRMEFVLFRHDGLNSPAPRLTDRDLWELRAMASEVMRYLSTVDEQLKDLVDTGRRVTFILSELAEDNHVTTWMRYRRMAQVVMRNLKKPRTLERRLLYVFLEFYDSYIYTAFLRVYDRPPEQETMSSAMTDLSQLLTEIWDVLIRAIENYEFYVNMMVNMRDTFFGPVMEELARCPELWQESWYRRQVQALEDAYAACEGAQWF